MLTVTLKENQEGDFTWRPKSPKGNAAPVENPAATVADASVVEVVGLTTDEDGKVVKGTIGAMGPAGMSQVEIDVDPKIGEEVGLAKLTLFVVVLPAEATDATDADVTLGDVRDRAA